MTKDQLITDNYAIYNSDCMYVLPTLPDNSVDLVVYSPPFAGLYNYSSSENDFSNCETKEEFLNQYEFLVKELARVTKPGRINAVHVTNIKDSKTGDMWEFPHEVIKIHRKYGFAWKDQITVWKEPLKVRMRTMVRSLMHKLIVEDSTECFTAMPDYVLTFRKKGENEVPVEHPQGLTVYHGAVPLLPGMISALKEYKKSLAAADEEFFDFPETWEDLKKKYKNWSDPKSNKLSHYIWQRYASSVWDDVRIDNVLQYKESKEEDDEKHVHPLQLDVINRIVELYTNKGEVVLTPFMGVGSEVYGPITLGRKAIGIELKESYFKQAIKNLANAKEPVEDPQLSLID